MNAMGTGIADWFSGLATPSGLLYVLTGFIAAHVCRYIKCKVKRRRVLISWQFTGIAVGVIAILITSVQTQIAYTTAKQTALEVQNCQREFNAALKARSKITTENDQLTQDRSLIVVSWIHALLFPPAPYDKMDPNDPPRQKYALILTLGADKKFRESLATQDALLAERDRHPLPDPTCGR